MVGRHRSPVVGLDVPYRPLDVDVLEGTDEQEVLENDGGEPVQREVDQSDEPDRFDERLGWRPNRGGTLDEWPLLEPDVEEDGSERPVYPPLAGTFAGMGEPYQPPIDGAQVRAARPGVGAGALDGWLSVSTACPGTEFGGGPEVGGRIRRVLGFSPPESGSHPSAVHTAFSW